LDIVEHIDKIEELINQARKVPFTSNVMVSEDEIYELIDSLRQILPEEIKQARWIVKERKELLDEAKNEADRIVSEAIDKATKLIAETEIIKKATKQAEEIVKDAENKARTIRLEAEDYADEKLANLEAILTKLITTVEKGRDQLQGKTSEE
jgi:vacuolar-type H+-ATPase subunit H